MFFIDKYFQISKHILDEKAVSIVLNQFLDKFIICTPSTISLISLRNRETITECLYKLTSNEIDSWGYINAAVCTGRYQFGCLTVKGKVLFFQINKNKISFQAELSFPNNIPTSMASYEGFGLLTDDSGYFFLVSVQMKSSISKQITNCLVKSLAVSKTHVLALLEDASVITFPINRSLLTDPGFEYDIKEYIKSNALIIAGSAKTPLSAVYCPNEMLVISDMKYYRKEYKDIPNISSMSFTPDGRSLIMASNTNFIIWSVDCPRLRYFYSQKINYARFMVVSNYYIVASYSKGIAYIPMCSLCPGNVLLFSNKFYRMILTNKRVISQVNNTNGCVGEILSVAVHDSSNMVVLSGSNGLCFMENDRIIKRLSRRNNNCLHFLQFMNDTLCFVVRTNKFVLVFCKITPNYDLRSIKLFNLPSKPIALRTSDKCCVVTCANHVVFVDALFNIYIHENRVSILYSEPCSTDTFVCLYQNSHLSFINVSNTEKILLTDVSSVFVDHKNQLLIVHKGFEILVSKIKEWDFKKIYEGEDIPVGIMPIIYGVLLIDPSCGVPYSPMIIHYFHLINKEVNNIVNIVRKLPTPEYSLTQFILMNMKFGNLRESINFLNHFPDYFSDILIKIIRTSEENERKIIYTILGDPINIFCKISNLKYIKGDYIRFESDNTFDEKLSERGSLFLEMLLADVDSLTALSAAVTILSKRDTPDIRGLIKRIRSAVEEQGYTEKAIPLYQILESNYGIKF